tara:strand:- start:53 stop:250 length:198 start_codon:yes stop_codon:yes gene_type:complete
MTEEQQKYIDAIVAAARTLPMMRGDSFEYGQYLGLLRATNIIEKGFHEDFSDPRPNWQPVSAQTK